MNCTFLVNSCDAYSDLWDPFFKLLEIHWPDCPYPIVLNTESKTFNHTKFDVKTFSLYAAGEQIPWGKRLIDTLNLIDTKYILFTLDDYFFEAPPNMERLNECFNWMEQNPSISVFQFKRSLGENIKDGLYPGFEKIPVDHDWRIRCQMALWRRDKLISYLMPHESPQQWEAEGSIRCRQYKEDDFYAVEDESPLPAIFTSLATSGGGLEKGLWRSTVVPLNKKHNLCIDFSKRGFRPEDRIPHKAFMMIYKMSKITGTYPLAKWVYRTIKGKEANYEKN